MIILVIPSSLIHSGTCPSHSRFSLHTSGSRWLKCVRWSLHWNAHLDPHIVPAVQDIFKYSLRTWGKCEQRRTTTLYLKRQLRTMRPVSILRILPIILCFPSGSTNSNSGPNRVSILNSFDVNGKLVLHASGAGGSTKMPSKPSRATATISRGHLTHVRRFFECRISECWARCRRRFAY